MDESLSCPAIAGYAAEADALIPRYAAISSADKLKPVVHLLPRTAVRAVDVGAGVGGDAAWLAQQGHSVLAIEPTAAFREAGQRLHRSDRIAWMDDSLPALDRVRSCTQRFQLALACGVWAHLPDALREQAMASLAALLEPAGRLVLSLRHGPAPITRPSFPVSARSTSEVGERHGLRPVFCCEADSIQAVNRAAGVTWTWMVFERQSRQAAAFQ